MVHEKKNHYQILVVDDEPLIRQSLYEILRIEGYRVQAASSAEEALNLIKKMPVDIIVTDMKLPKMSGIELLSHVKKDYPKTEVIVITGYGSIETAVDAMKKGAYDYITKPINDQEIKVIITKIIEKRELLEENEDLKRQLAQGRLTFYCGMIGGSDKMQRLYHMIDSVASTNATVLITGESGTGKGLIAKAVHQMDRNRNNKPFVEVSCGALSETLLESELFGHMKGAFTGAIKDKEGRFEYACGGTIFLDEIDAFSPALQVKLLRVLQDGVFERVGDNETRKTNTRVIVATNQNLGDLVKEQKFREDLYYRINVISLHLPPLRERKEDLDILAKHFIEKYNKVNHRKIKGVSAEVQRMFKDYDWPGNIRELENAIEGAVIMAKAETIERWDIPNNNKFSQSPSRKPNEDKSLKRLVEQPEREFIISVLNENNWNRNKAALALGINRTTLYNKMKKYNILESKSRK